MNHMLTMGTLRLQTVLYISAAFLHIAKADTCGVSQYCFRSPENCFPASNCNYFAGWSLTESGDALNFEVSISGDMGYVALGLSKDDKMPMTDITLCLSNGNVKRYFASEKSTPEEQASDGISNELVTFESNTMNCTFTRQLTREGDANFYDLNDPHYVLLATGPLDDAGTGPGYHDGTKLASMDTFDFTKHLDDTCGVSQTCFRSPRNCYPASSCEYFAGWSSTESGDALNFEVSTASDNGYIALGLSKDDKMPMTDITACSSDGNIKRYYASERAPPEEQTSDGISNAVVTFESNTRSCTFTRQLTREGDANFYDLNDPHYVLLATGPLNNDTGLGYHGSTKWFSMDIFDFQKHPADTCGVSQTCFRSPENCFPASTCDYFAGWALTGSGDALNFEVSISGNNGYIALGFSEDNLMPMTDIVACLSNDNISRYYADERSQPTEQAEGGISNEVVTIVEGNIAHCTFTRVLSLEGQDNFYDLNEPHYLLLASGPLENGALGYHMTQRWQSTNEFSFIEETTEAPGKSDGDTCSVSQSCFREPTNCFPSSSCDYFVGWALSADEQSVQFEFTMSGSNGFIAIGFSKDNKMPITDIIGCLSNDNINRYYATAKSPPAPQTESGVSDEEVTVDGGRIACRFTRPLNSDTLENFFDFTEGNHYILVARGDLNGGELQYHSNMRYFSGEAFDLDSPEFSSAGGVEDDRFAKIKAHGSMMIIAWIGLASIGVFTARFMKPAFPNTKWCGSAVWFRIHAGCMITAWVTFVASFILIFVTVDGWVGDDDRNTYYHAIIGCVVVGLGTLNPIMAIVRPHPGTKWRPLFNVMHWAVGFCGWIGANITVFFGIRIFYRGEEKAIDIEAFNVLIALEVFLFLMFLAFELVQAFEARQKDAAATDNIALDPVDRHNKSAKTQVRNASSSKGGAIRYMLYFLCLVGIVLAVAFMVVTIVTEEE